MIRGRRPRKGLDVAGRDELRLTGTSATKKKKQERADSPHRALPEVDEPRHHPYMQHGEQRHPGAQAPLLPTAYSVHMHQMRSVLLVACFSRRWTPCGSGEQVEMEVFISEDGGKEAAGDEAKPAGSRRGTRARARGGEDDDAQRCPCLTHPAAISRPEGKRGKRAADRANDTCCACGVGEARGHTAAAAVDGRAVGAHPGGGRGKGRGVESILLVALGARGGGIERLVKWRPEGLNTDDVGVRQRDPPSSGQVSSSGRPSSGLAGSSQAGSLNPCSVQRCHRFFWGLERRGIAEEEELTWNHVHIPYRAESGADEVVFYGGRVVKIEKKKGVKYQEHEEWNITDVQGLPPTLKHDIY
ncbi:hypothetical protein DFH09DRAFT_1093918 [Mycena vulgaris]|nr:hypothetical protein DFH09DRAFT_1093918 [Mycena vulgaris]